MTLVRWRPMRDVWSIQDEINRTFDNFFGRTEREEWTESRWAPAVDISENKDDLMVNVEVPGMKKEDIKVTLQDGILTVKGERKQEKEEKDKNFHRVERSYGSFCRSFTLPTTVQGDKIKANYKDGILMISLPKVEEVKPKEISIDVA
jgi:HSP20 family protein